MDPGGSDPSTRHGEREVLDVGSPRRPVPRWLVVAGVLVLAVAGAVLLIHTQQQPGSRQQPALPSPATPAAGSRTPVPAAMTAGPPVVTDLGHPVLGVTGDWELFGYARGRHTLVRIEPARGRVTRTPVPPLQSSGPLSVVVGPGQVLVHPLDSVPGYVVRDGHRASRQPIPDGGLVLPGPSPGQLWQAYGDGSMLRLRLTGFDGRDTGRRLTAPIPTPWPVVPDGQGYVLARAPDGMYDVRPGSSHRVATVTVSAVGPRTWLLLACDAVGRCHRVVVDRDTGERHRLGRVSGAFAGRPGLISPDGTTAAVPHVSRSPTAGVRLVDLATGAEQVIRLRRASGEPELAWSPDGRWLFIADGRLLALDTRRHRLVDLGDRLGQKGVTQVAVRTR